MATCQVNTNVEQVYCLRVARLVSLSLKRVILPRASDKGIGHDDGSHLLSHLSERVTEAKFTLDSYGKK